MSFTAGPSPRERTRNQNPFNLAGICVFWARRRRRMGATALVVFILSFSVLLLEQPKYTATALMTVHAYIPSELPNSNREIVALSAVDFELERDLLRSPFMMHQLVESLALYNDSEWNPPLSGDLAALLNLVGAASADTARVRKRVSAAINVRRRAPSAVLEVSATSASPERAAQMANRLVELHLALYRRYQHLGEAYSWRTVRGEAEREEDAHNLIQMRHLSTPGTCDAAELKAAPARAELAEKQARYDQARRVIQSGPPGVLIDSERLAHLRARRADMLRRHAELESSYGALDPAVHDAHAELSDLEALMAAESARELMRLRNEAGLARARLATLHQKIAECPRPGVDRPFRLRELPGGGSDHQHDLYKLLQRIRPPAREREPSMASAATAPESPNPPKFGRAFLLSIGLGLASALAAGLLTELSWDSPR